MTILSDNLKKARKANKLAQEQVAQLLREKYQLKVDRAMVSKWETGFQTPNIYYVKCLSEIYHVSMDELNQLSDNQSAPNVPKQMNEKSFTTYKVPILGSVACGEPIYSPESADVYVSVSKGLHADFALMAKGDSMIGEHIFDGDIVLIRTQPEVELGQIAAISINDEVTLKHTYYYPETQKLILQSANPKYEPMVYVGEELNTIRILGKAVAVQHVLN